MPPAVQSAARLTLVPLGERVGLALEAEAFRPQVAPWDAFIAQDSTMAVKMAQP